MVSGGLRQGQGRELGATWEFTFRAVGQVAFSLLLALIASLLLFKFIPRLPFGRQLVLDTGLTTSEGYVSAPGSDLNWLGKSGRAVSPLRPAGIADIEHQRVDVVSDGEFIDAGSQIIVIRVDGNRIVVRRHPPTTEGS